MAVALFLLFSGSPASSYHRGMVDTKTYPPAGNRGVEWIGTRGEREPDPYATMTAAERIQLVWPLSVAAWAFAGKPYDESRLRRDVECVVHRTR